MNHNNALNFIPGNIFPINKQECDEIPLNLNSDDEEEHHGHYFDFVNGHNISSIATTFKSPLISMMEIFPEFKDGQEPQPHLPVMCLRVSKMDCLEIINEVSSSSENASLPSKSTPMKSTSTDSFDRYLRKKNKGVTVATCVTPPISPLASSYYGSSSSREQTTTSRNIDLNECFESPTKSIIALDPTGSAIMISPDQKNHIFGNYNEKSEMGPNRNYEVDELEFRIEDEFLKLNIVPVSNNLEKVNSESLSESSDTYRIHGSEITIHQVDNERIITNGIQTQEKLQLPSPRLFSLPKSPPSPTQLPEPNLDEPEAEEPTQLSQIDEPKLAGPFLVDEEENLDSPVIGEKRLHEQTVLAANNFIIPSNNTNAATTSSSITNSEQEEEGGEEEGDVRELQYLDKVGEMSRGKRQDNIHSPVLLSSSSAFQQQEQHSQQQQVQVQAQELEMTRFFNDILGRATAGDSTRNESKHKPTNSTDSKSSYKNVFLIGGGGANNNSNSNYTDPLVQPSPSHSNSNSPLPQKSRHPNRPSTPNNNNSSRESLLASISSPEIRPQSTPTHKKSTYLPSRRAPVTPATRETTSSYPASPATNSSIDTHDDDGYPNKKQKKWRTSTMGSVAYRRSSQLFQSPTSSNATTRRRPRVGKLYEMVKKISTNTGGSPTGGSSSGNGGSDKKLNFYQKLFGTFPGSAGAGGRGGSGYGIFLDSNRGDDFVGVDRELYRPLPLTDGMDIDEGGEEGGKSEDDVEFEKKMKWFLNEEDRKQSLNKFMDAEDDDGVVASFKEYLNYSLL